MTDFTQFETDVENISKLPDKPNIELGYTSKDLKAAFDKAGVDIKNFLNFILIDQLRNSGASRIGSDAIDGVAGINIQEKLVSLKSLIDGIENGVIPEGSISADKFQNDIKSFITEGSLRYTAYTEPGSYTFIPPRTGTYKVTVVGGGAGGTIGTSFPFVGAGVSGGASVGAFTLEKGFEYQITVGAGGEGALADEEGSKLSDGKEGNPSSFGRGGNILIFADGGKKSASSWGGYLNIKGKPPSFTHTEKTSSRDYYVFGRGESAYLGIGTGGSAPSLSSKASGGFFFESAEKGGDGAVIIEYVA